MIETAIIVALVVFVLNKLGLHIDLKFLKQVGLVILALLLLSWLAGFGLFGGLLR